MRLRRKARPLPVLVVLAAAALSALALTAPLAAAFPLSRAERVESYWTPQRMRAAVPLEYVRGPDGDGHAGTARAADPLAAASFAQVETPEVPPYSFNGRVFFRRGRFDGLCSATAIDSPTRKLVLTAGHCVDSGPEGRRPNVASSFIEFVPALNGQTAPFGIFVAAAGQVFAPTQWTRDGNPDYDMGAFLTEPNAEGVNVADAVGGGAKILMDRSRHQTFQTFGYPGERRYLQTCSSPYNGEDSRTLALPGPPTLGVRCRWAPGASGGGWLIRNGTAIDGINTYLLAGSRNVTYGPYFSRQNIGRLVKGL
jgi:V8-like Glu-specific endopeptidase